MPPYPQSWLNRLIDWIDRLPGSAWPYHLLVATLSTAAFVGVQAQAGMYAVGFVPVHVFLALQPVGCLAVMHHLSRLAGESFRRFAPALDS
jgi:hypothetical protein